MRELCVCCRARGREQYRDEYRQHYRICKAHYGKGEKGRQ